MLPDAEWSRVQALIDLVEARRCVRASVEEAQAAKTAADKALTPLRGTSKWKELVAEYQLDKLDEQILLLALAPVAQPRINWYYRVLQPGDTTGFAGIDLICELLDVEPAEVAKYRNRLSFNAPLIKRGILVWEQSSAYAPLRPTYRTLQRIFGLRNTGHEVPGATLVRSNLRLRDVVCSSTLRDRLEELAAWPDRDRHISKQWAIPIDHGPVALFSGPSGTGKTMAAEAVAEETGRALYRVDLGMLVSKYIGETEKNLNAMFDSARELDCILLFDEADSLFGKRGEVKDAKDRYANMEVGHLLSRIERHVGTCILTTNLKEHIDTAFLRRIDLVLQFELPESAERLALWKRYLGPVLQQTRQMAASAKLFEELASLPRLTGAQIANACRYLLRRVAAAEEVSANALLAALAEGVRVELDKAGREAHRSNLGFLHGHLRLGACA